MRKATHVCRLFSVAIVLAVWAVVIAVAGSDGDEQTVAILITIAIAVLLSECERQKMRRSHRGGH